MFLLKQTWDMPRERHEFNIQNKIQGNSIPQSSFSYKGQSEKDLHLPFNTILHLQSQRQHGTYQITMSIFTLKLRYNFENFIAVNYATILRILLL